MPKGKGLADLFGDRKIKGIKDRNMLPDELDLGPKDKKKVKKTSMMKKKKRMGMYSA